MLYEDHANAFKSLIFTLCFRYYTTILPKPHLLPTFDLIIMNTLRPNHHIIRKRKREKVKFKVEFVLMLPLTRKVNYKNLFMKNLKLHIWMNMFSKYIYTLLTIYFCKSHLIFYESITSIRVVLSLKSTITYIPP